MMKICVVGAGYVGLTAAVMFAMGHQVSCIDINKERVKALNNGIVNIYEPSLEDAMQHALANGALVFGDNYDVVQDADLVIVAVGTPTSSDGISADLSYVYDAVQAISERNTACPIIIKSTVPPGTCDSLIAMLRQLGRNNDIASNPEFLREGAAIYDFLHPDRIVVGSHNHDLFDIVKDLYGAVLEQTVPIVFTNPASSELIKYASNGFLSAKLAFINEMADICEKCGANIDDVANGMGMDMRIGRHFLATGPGFGGSCFPKDILSLIDISNKLNIDVKLCNAIVESNEARYVQMAQKVLDIASLHNIDVTKEKVAILGLAFKAATDDIRSSPAILIIKRLLAHGANITAYDVAAMKNVNIEHPEIQCATSIIEACTDASMVVIMTEWLEFINADWHYISTIMRKKIALDLRRVLNKFDLTELGFSIYSIGEKL